MRINITTQRYVILDELIKAAKPLPAFKLGPLVGYNEPNNTAIHHILKDMTELGLLRSVKQTFPDAPTRYKRLLSWTVTPAGRQLFDDVDRVRGDKDEPEQPQLPLEVSSRESVNTPLQYSEEWALAATPPVAEATLATRLVAEPDTRVSELEAEIARLKAMVAKYAVVTVDVPNVGPVSMSKDEAYDLFLELSKYAQED